MGAGGMSRFAFLVIRRAAVDAGMGSPEINAPAPRLDWSAGGALYVIEPTETCILCAGQRNWRRRPGGLREKKGYEGYCKIGHGTKRTPTRDVAIAELRQWRRDAISSVPVLALRRDGDIFPALHVTQPLLQQTPKVWLALAAAFCIRAGHHNALLLGHRGNCECPHAHVEVAQRSRGAKSCP